MGGINLGGGGQLHMGEINLGSREWLLPVLQVRCLGLCRIVVGRNMRKRLFSGRGCGLLIFCKQLCLQSVGLLHTINSFGRGCLFPWHTEILLKFFVCSWPLGAIKPV